MADPKREKKEKARQLYMQARLYRFIAILMLAAGILVFTLVYFQSFQGHELEALADPGTIGLVLLPFLPAAVFAIMAGRLERHLEKTLAELDKLKAAEQNEDA